MEALSSKKNLPDLLPRLKRFLDREMPDQILATFPVDSEPLRRFGEDTSADCPYPNPSERGEFWRSHLSEYSRVEDDTVPSAYLSEFDQGLYDGGLLHIHGNGRHLLEAVRDLLGLKAIYLGDDTGFPRAIEIAGDIRRTCGDVPLVIGTDIESLRSGIKERTLPGGTLYMVADRLPVDCINREILEIRKYRVDP